MSETSNPNHAQRAKFPTDDAAHRERDVALRERIEKRAYHLWLAGGGGHGEHLRHWLQAESEIFKLERQLQVERGSSAKLANRRPSPSTHEANPKI